MQIAASGGMAMMQQMHQRMFQQADADEDGTLSLDEFKSIGQNMPADKAKPAGAPSVEEMFSKMDKDGDGKLTMEEMEPPKPQFDTQNMSILLNIQEQSQQDATSNDGTTSDATDTSSKLSDLVQQLLENFGQIQDLMKTDGANGTQTSGVDLAA